MPNPSNGPVNIIYEVPDAVELAEVRVMNTLGQLTYRQRLSGKGILEMQSPRGSCGLHILGLYFDGQLVATVKLQLIR